MRLLLFVTFALFALETPPAPVPNYDWQGGPAEYKGQPAFCISTDTTKWLANCACKSMPVVGRKDDCGRNARPMVKTKCKTECRKACFCEAPKKPETTE